MAKNRTDWEALHFKRTQEFAHQVTRLFELAVQDAARLADSVRGLKDRFFTFEDYPMLNHQIREILSDLAEQLTRLIQTGQQAEWDLSNQKNDTFVRETLASAGLDADRLPIAAHSRWMARNMEALEAFQARKVKGMGLSERVWKYTNQFRGELEMAIDLALADGRSAQQLSRDIRRYLNNPDALFRRVRDKYGILQLSKRAENYHPGQGVYRSAYKNAMRLARTEINMAYREADYNRWQTLDFVVGFEVRRSNRPFGCEVCESLKGRYPKAFKFVGWHPQCRCYVVSILVTKDEMQELTRRALQGQSTSGFRSVNEVQGMPEGYQDWVRQNTQRLLRAKSQPYFIRDNYKGGKLSGGLRPDISSAPATPPAQKKIIDLSKFIKGDLPTNQEVKALLTHYASLHPEHFKQGLGEIKFQKSGSYLMQHSLAYSPRTGEWVGESTISISTANFFTVSGPFNPGAELKEALAAIKSGQQLTFNQEYAIESLWHEILHAKSKTPPRRLIPLQVEKMETVNQFIARHTYDQFLEDLGGKAAHKAEILENGLGYRSWVKNFREELKYMSIPEEQAVKDLMPILMDDYGLIHRRLREYLAKWK